MKSWRAKSVSLLLLATFLSAACAAVAPGPTHPAFMGSGKTAAEFQRDDDYCRKVAMQRTGISPGDAAAQNTGIGAVIGMLAGAALGAAIGAATGSPSAGAAIGAGAGLVGGVGMGAAHGSATAASAQQRLDSEYYGCMYAAGHQVPGVAAQRSQTPAYAPPPPPPPASSPSYGPPPAAAAPCEPTGKYVKTPGGFVPECKYAPEPEFKFFF